MGRGRRQLAGGTLPAPTTVAGIHTSPPHRPPPATAVVDAFASALTAAFASEGLPVPEGETVEAHLQDLRVAPSTNHVLDTAFIATLRAGDPATAYLGLGWAVGCLADQNFPAPLGRAADACALPGEITAAERLADLQPAMRMHRLVHPPLWQTVLDGNAGILACDLACDGLAGDTHAFARCAENDQWRFGPAFSRMGCEFHELCAAIRGWRAAGGHAPPGMVAALDVHLDQAATLIEVAAFGEQGLRLRVDESAASYLVAEAALVVDGERLCVRGYLPAPEEVVSDGWNAIGQWASEMLDGRDVTVEHGKLPPRPGISLESTSDLDLTWTRTPRYRLRPSPPCVHASASWIRNATNTALVLDCPDCGRAQLALCWRDELPAQHPDRIEASSARGTALDALRVALGTFGPTEPQTGHVWTYEELSPSRWADPQPRTWDAATTRAGSPEALLTRRRTRPIA